MLNRQSVVQIWDLFGKAEVDLFASQESSQFPGTSGHRHVCPFLAERETVRVSASKANSRSPVQGEGERCPSPTRSPILAISDVVLWADSHSVSAPLVDSDQAGPALSFRARSFLQDIYTRRCTRKARRIIKDSSHPSHRLLSLLPSGRRFRSIRSRTSRLRDSFFPQAIRLMNSQKWPTLQHTPTHTTCHALQFNTVQLDYTHTLH